MARPGLAVRHRTSPKSRFQSPSLPEGCSPSRCCRSTYVLRCDISEDISSVKIYRKTGRRATGDGATGDGVTERRAASAATGDMDQMTRVPNDTLTLPELMADGWLVASSSLPNGHSACLSDGLAADDSCITRRQNMSDDLRSKGVQNQVTGAAKEAEGKVRDAAADITGDTSEEL